MNEMKCPQCGGSKLQAYGNGVYKCLYCGNIINQQPSAPTQPQPAPVQPQVQPAYQPQFQPAYQPQPQNIYIQQQRQKLHDRSKGTAAVLALFLGGLGAHKFYLGQTGLGFIYLIFCLTGIPSCIALIEGIIYLCKSSEEFDEAYNY